MKNKTVIRGLNNIKDITEQVILEIEILEKEFDKLEDTISDLEDTISDLEKQINKLEQWDS